ncbi:hypothetical protein ABZX74_29065 [Streptomyces olivaceoviridis]|uniref:TetR/AcrR family transcriptional regulator n=1 Tax=Streptomyces olivaceoviridis TaxID=1921 RepID=UPI0033B59604
MIAKRAGVTQPHLFRLLPGKRAIFVAALTRSMEDTRLAFERAADGVEGGEQALHGLANAYARLISAHPGHGIDAGDRPSWQPPRRRAMTRSASPSGPAG